MAIEQKLRLYLEPWQPMIPNPRLVAIWNEILPELEELLRLQGTPLDYVCGYYKRNVKVFAERLTCYHSRKIVFFNLYFFEFFLDFLLFSETPTEGTFFHLYCKYLRDYSDIDSDPENVCWRFFQYQFDKTSYSIEPIHLLHSLRMASAGMFFITLHEHHHIDQELFQIARRMLETQDAVKQYNIPDLLDRDKDEISCDFCALSLYLSMGPSLQEHFALTREEIFACALIAIHMNLLYTLLLSYDPITRTTAKHGDDLEALFETRTKPLITIAKISQNSQWEDYQNIDFIRATDLAMEKIRHFMQYFATILSRLEKLANEYNELDDTRKPPYKTRCILNKDDMWLSTNIT